MKNQIFESIALAGGSASTGAAVVSAIASVAGLTSLPAIAPIAGAGLGLLLAIDWVGKIPPLTA